MQASLVDVFHRHAAATPDAPCLTFEGVTLTYGQLYASSSRLAQALLDLGVVSGDRVAIIARNAPVFYELAFACAFVGAIMLPINWRLAAKEVSLIVKDATPKLILAGSNERSLVPTDPDSPASITLDQHYPAWRDRAANFDPENPVDPDGVWFLLYTSGTTGLPKGAMLTHRNLSYTENMAREAWGFTSSSVNLVAMPLFHIGGIGYGMMSLSQGGQTLLFRQPDPERVLAAIEEYGVTHTFLVPAVIQALLAASDAKTIDFSSLELIAYGASPINETLLLRAMEVFKCKFSHAYGATETAGTVIRLAPEDHDPGGANAGRLKSCGLPLPWVEIGLFDPSVDRQVPHGEVGEIWVRSRMNMLGYWGKPEETAATLTLDGWLRTGDVAYQDTKGYVYLHDRYKDMIVSGGENIYPTEVENVLYEHAGVSEAAVIGVAHERWGETPKAIVVLSPGASLSKAELIEFVRARIAHYKCPTSVELVAELPRNASGKVLKRTLRDIYGSQYKRQA